MTPGEERHHRACGECSGFPPCCVEWFVRAWVDAPVIEGWRPQYTALIALADAHLPSPRYYVPCPACLFSGCVVSFRSCDRERCTCHVTVQACEKRTLSSSVKPVRQYWDDARERQAQVRFPNAHVGQLARALAPLVRAGTQLAMTSGMMKNAMIALAMAGCVSGVEDVVSIPSFGEQVTCHVDIACPGHAEDTADRPSCSASLEVAQDAIFATCDDCYCVVVCEQTSWFPCLESQ